MYIIDALSLINIIINVTFKPRNFFVKWKTLGRGYGRMYSEIISQAHAQRRVLRVERTFMASEYESRKHAITPFSKSSVIIDPNFESRNLILSTRD